VGFVAPEELVKILEAAGGGEDIVAAAVSQ
jgi:hypothetical protein